MLAKEVPLGLIDGLVHHQEVRKAAGLTADDLMTHPAVTVRPEDSIEHAARLMYSLRIKRLPVVDAGGGLVGVISRTDLLAVYDRPDSEIRAEIEGLILHEFLEDPRQFAVQVQDGVVTLAGSPETAELGQHIVRQDPARPGRGGGPRPASATPTFTPSSRARSCDGRHREHAQAAGQVYALLADGTTVEIRPAGPGDFDAVKAMHQAMSPDNTYMRFFNISRLAAETEARRICQDPAPGRMALLALAGDEVVGVASYVSESPGAGRGRVRGGRPHA